MFTPLGVPPLGGLLSTPLGAPPLGGLSLLFECEEELFVEDEVVVFVESEEVVFFVEGEEVVVDVEEVGFVDVVVIELAMTELRIMCLR